MKTALSGVVLTAIAVALTSPVVTAQIVPLPDPSLWVTSNGDPGGLINPDGSEAVPALIYDNPTGLMWLDSSGLNQTLDTTMSFWLGGDDVGFIAMSFDSPDPMTYLLDGFVNNPIIGGGVVWSNQYFGGKTQIFGVGAGSDYLEPNKRTDLWQFAPGLTSADFGEVEVAVNFGEGPGGTMFGSVQMLIPEPSGCLIAMPAVVGFVGIVRRRRK